MPSTINAKNTSTGVVITPDASGQLELQTADTTRLTIDVNGNVGIGTTSPTAGYRLSLTGGVGLNLQNTGASDNTVVKYSNSSKNWYVGLRGDTSNIWAVADDSAFRMVVDGSGNVGIGTASPSNKLDVNGVVNASTATTTADAYKFSGWSLIGGDVYDLKFGGYTNGQFRQILFYANNSSGVSSERMRIASDGVITSSLGGMQVISGTSVSASGTSVTFTGIPSWAKKITVMFNGISSNGTSNYLIQLGSGSITTSGYTGCAANQNASAQSNFSAGFVVVLNPVATSVLSGVCSINNLSGNVWTESGTLAFNTVAAMNYSAGSVSLSGTLDRVRITTVNGTDSFDAGSINILYE